MQHEYTEFVCYVFIVLYLLYKIRFDGIYNRSSEKMSRVQFGKTLRSPKDTQGNKLPIKSQQNAVGKHFGQSCKSDGLSYKSEKKYRKCLIQL